MPSAFSFRHIGRILRRQASWAALPLAALWILCGPPNASAHPEARFYRGDIVVSTSWDGVIRLTGTVVIFPGVTVTVDPGTEILVQPGSGTNIVVRGRLLVRGLPGKPVLFDTAGGCSDGAWGGVVFEPGSTGILENIRVRCSGRGIIGELGEVSRTGVVLERER